MPGVGYLPPVVAQLLASDADAIAKIGEVKVALQDLSKTPTEVTITADGADAIAEAEAAHAEVATIAGRPVTIPINLSGLARAMAQITAMHAAASLAHGVLPYAGAGGGGGILPPSGGGGEGGGGVLPVPVGGGGGGGGGAGGVLSKLLWGGGGFAGMAGAFSIASMAGLGFEHVLTTAIGLAGSLAGALGGMAILAVGVFGKMAVGMGSDMLVMRSVLADTKTLNTAYTNIASAGQTVTLTHQAMLQAIAQYGAGSAQATAATFNYQSALQAAQAAQTALQQTMMSLGNTAGVQAEAGLARMMQALNSFWDQATSTARVAAVGFIEPFLSVAYTYIPLIAQAATTNFTIMTAAFKPLITWMNGPGTAIFQNLERLFAASIPVGVGALTNFVELLAKVANWAAPQTGGIMISIEKFLAYLNSTAGFTKLEGFMTTLVKMFHDWWNLIKQIGITLYDVFSQSLGVGTSIVVTLTNMLKHLDAYLTSASGKASMHNVFQVHLQEVLALLALLPPLVAGFGHVYMSVGPALTGAFVLVLRAITPVLAAMAKNPTGVWILGFALIAGKLGLLGPLFGALKLQLSGASSGFANFSKSAATAATSTAASAAEMQASMNKAFGTGSVSGGGWLSNIKGMGSSIVSSLGKFVNMAMPGIIGAALGTGLGSGIGGAIGGSTGGAVGGIVGGIGMGAGMGAMMGPWGAAIGAAAGALMTIGPAVAGMVGQILAFQKAAAAGTQPLQNLADLAKGAGGAFGLGGSMGAQQDVQGLITNLHSAGVSSGNLSKEITALAGPALVAANTAGPMMGRFGTSWTNAAAYSDTMTQDVQSLQQLYAQHLLKTTADVHNAETILAAMNAAGIRGQTATQDTAVELQLLQQFATHNISLTAPLLQSFSGSWAQIAKSGQNMSLVQGALFDAINHAGMTNPGQINAFLGEWASLNLNGTQSTAAFQIINNAITSGAVTTPGQVQALLTNWGAIVKNTGDTNVSTQQLAKFAGLASLTGQNFSNGIAGLASAMNVPENNLLRAFTQSAAYAAAVRNSIFNWNATINSKLAALNRSIPGTAGITGHGIGFLGGMVGYAKGGVITEPIVGYGLQSGKGYSFGEEGLPEYVVSQSGARSMGGGGGGMSMINHVKIEINGGPTNAQTGVTVEQAVYKAMAKVGRQLGGGASYGLGLA